MDLIDRAALRKQWKMAAECRLCDNDVNECRLHGLTIEQICIGIDNVPTVEAVPLDKLCEWLAEQDYEIYCFMCQEQFDTGGGCPNQVSDSQWRCGGKEHWKAFLMKVMEGLNGSSK